MKDDVECYLWNCGIHMFKLLNFVSVNFGRLLAFVCSVVCFVGSFGRHFLEGA